MGEAPGGGSLSTYKELCALATDMGQPDLVYRFMDLANHHASLNSSRGAAFGYATCSLLASTLAQTAWTLSYVCSMHIFGKHSCTTCLDVDLCL